MVPALTCSVGIKLNPLIKLHACSEKLILLYRTISPKSGSAPAKPSGEHTPLGGFVFETTSAPRLVQSELSRRHRLCDDGMALANRIDHAQRV